MKKLVTVLIAFILMGTLLVSAVVGQEGTDSVDSSKPYGLQLDYPGSVNQILTYKWDSAKFHMNVENFGGYEIKVNANTEVSGDTGYFLTWLDKEGFSVGPWGSSKFTLHVLARFPPEPDRTEEIDITITIESGIYRDSMSFHVVLVDNGVEDLGVDEYNSDASRNKSPVQEIFSVVSTACSRIRSVCLGR